MAICLGRAEGRLIRTWRYLFYKSVNEFSCKTWRSLCCGFRSYNQVAMSQRNILPSQVKQGVVKVPLIASLGVPTCCAHSSSGDFPKKFSEKELKERLTPMQYKVTQHAGTERAFTGEYWDNHEKGIYKCVVCAEDLFDSGTKFDSGTGWPSFYDVLEKGKVKLISDSALGMTRTEVICAQCGAHLGHVFDDGPRPTGQRYCMNSASLNFSKKN